MKCSRFIYLGLFHRIVFALEVYFCCCGILPRRYCSSTACDPCSKMPQESLGICKLLAWVEANAVRFVLLYDTMIAKKKTVKGFSQRNSGKPGTKNFTIKANDLKIEAKRGIGDGKVSSRVTLFLIPPTETQGIVSLNPKNRRPNGRCYSSHLSRPSDFASFVGGSANSPLITSIP